jgi:adenosylmethionine-8-amino-7-oxononanoate aminotransferase
MIEEAHKKFSVKISSKKTVRSVRAKGTILAIELNTKDQTRYLNNASESISDFFLERKIILRPLGNVFYLIPPYVIKEGELEKVYAAIEEFLNR